MGRCMVTEVQLAAYGGGECLRQTEFSFGSRIVDEEGPEDSRLWAHWNLAWLAQPEKETREQTLGWPVFTQTSVVLLQGTW